MKLALVFTLGVSVDTWYKQGVLDREKLIYEELLRQKKFTKIYWFTYGVGDKKFQDLLAEDIEIVPLPAAFRNKLGRLLYSLLMPVLCCDLFKPVDIIKTNQIKGAWAGALAALLYRKKFVLRAGYLWSTVTRAKYGRGRYLVTKILEGLMAKLADQVIVTSRWQRDYILKEYGLKENKLFLVPNYIDVKRFRPDSGRPKLEGRLIFVGRIHEEKNLTNAILALKGLGLGLDIYGSGHLRRKLERMAYQSDLDARFKGVVANARLPEVLRQYHYFILPSRYEGMPKALLEAMACGLVAIGTDVPGIAEIIRDGQTGLLIDGVGVASIQKVFSWLGKDRQAEEEIKVRAVQYIKENFSLERVAAEEARLYT
jgi:glycosyltransferase involved in cell wall biosynthesis